MNILAHFHGPDGEYQATVRLELPAAAISVYDLRCDVSGHGREAIEDGETLVLDVTLPAPRNGLPAIAERFMVDVDGGDLVRFKQLAERLFDGTMGL